MSLTLSGDFYRVKASNLNGLLKNNMFTLEFGEKQNYFHDCFHQFEVDRASPGHMRVCY